VPRREPVDLHPQRFESVGVQPRGERHGGQAAGGSAP
jgi:hypothetical protein